jgi:hypothetical protein
MTSAIATVSDNNSITTLMKPILFACELTPRKIQIYPTVTFLSEMSLISDRDVYGNNA